MRLHRGVGLTWKRDEKALLKLLAGCCVHVLLYQRHSHARAWEIPGINQYLVAG